LFGEYAIVDNQLMTNRIVVDQQHLLFPAGNGRMDIGNHRPHDFLGKGMIHIKYAIAVIVLEGYGVIVKYMPALLFELC
jgi:hypothetical protein